jgi:V8-like Glu-specific endopeptidase
MHQCTAFMIAPGAAATAAHCLHGSGGGFPQQVFFTPAFNGKRRPYGFTTAA